MAVNRVKNRIDWIDVMRAAAILLVLLSHYDGGKLSVLANRACVQTFFFISGMFAFSSKYSLKSYVKKQAETLLLPYGIFAVVNIAFYWLFNRDTPISQLALFAKNFLFAKRNEVLVAAMWFLPCLFFASILYKAIAMLLKKQKYIFPLCFVISAVFKIWFESPVYIFSINQGLKYLVYIALGGVMYPYLKRIKRAWHKLPKSYHIAVILFFAVDCAYIWRMYVKGYVFWPKSVVMLSAVYFLNVVMCIIFIMTVSILLEKVKPLVWIGRHTLGFCCLESINRALFNTAMAIVGIGFVPNSEIKALVHAVISVCIGSVIVSVLDKICPIVLGKRKNKRHRQRHTEIKRT